MDIDRWLKEREEEVENMRASARSASLRACLYLVVAVIATVVSLISLLV